MARRIRRGRSDRGAALILAIIAISIVTLLGLALVSVTELEAKLAATEGHINRAFYSSDAGIQWVAAGMAEPGRFLTKPELIDPGYAVFRLPDNTPSEDPADLHITVRVDRPALLGRRFFEGSSLNVQRKQYMYDYQIVSQSRNSFLSTDKVIQADIEVGPLPDAPPGFKP
jgi:hypothetical protein